MINNFWSDSLDGGTATGEMNLFGSFDTLGVQTDLVINGFEKSNIALSSLTSESVIVYFSKSSKIRHFPTLLELLNDCIVFYVKF